MNKRYIAFARRFFLMLLWLAIFSVQAYAAIDNVGVLNKAHDKFEAAAAAWQTVMIARATWLFWLLALLSMVWTFGTMALRKADIGEFFSEFVRFTLFTGFFWWLLLNGPNFAIDIMKSLRAIGAQASGLPNDLGPSSIVDVGFDIFYKVIDQATVWKPMDSLFGMLLGVAILIAFALVGANMLLLLISGYIFAYAGIFILGFGGSKWTSEMAVGYYKSVLNIGLQLMTMVLIIGIGRSFLDEYYASMSAGIQLKEMGVMAVVAAVLLFLVAKIPPQIGALVGGTTGALGSNFGAGAAVGAAAMAAAAISSGGAAVAAGAAGMAGGAQALMAAFSKANAAEGGSGDRGMGALADDASGASTNNASAKGGAGGSPLAEAMGDSSGGLSGVSASNDSSQSSTGNGNSEHASDAGNEGSKASANGSEENRPDSSGVAKPGGAMAAAGAIAAKVGRVASGTAANLAQGSYDVAKAKISNIRSSTEARIAATTGGKIAAAVRADAYQSDSVGRDKQFDENSLSAGVQGVDAKAEIAAFRDRA